MSTTADAAAPPPAPVPDELEPGVLPFRSRLKRWLLLPVRLVGALLLPDRVAVGEVREGRWGAALLTVTLAALLASWIVGHRIDLRPQVMQQADMMSAQMGGGGGGGGGPGGAMEPPSDRDLEDQIKKDTSVYQVTHNLGAGIVTPLFIGILGLWLYLIGRYVGSRPTLLRTMSASAQSYLPIAVKSLLVAVAAFRADQLTPPDADGLAASGSFTLGIVHLDAFSLWSVVILGFAFAEAGQMSRLRSFTTVIVLFALKLALTGAIGGHS